MIRRVVTAGWQRRAWAVLAAALAAAPASAALPAMRPVTAADSVLVVAPHPDDESLCCGGLIHMARAAGARVSIVWITSGDAFRWDAMVINHSALPRSAAYRSLAATREGEARAAAGRLGVGADSIYFLGYPDSGLSPLMGNYYIAPWRSPFTSAQSVIYADALDPGARYEGASLEHDFDTVLDRVRPTLVLAPSPRDTHPDHRGAGLLARRTLAARGELGSLRYWIVHGGTGWPQGGFAPTRSLGVPPTGIGLQWEELRLDDGAIAAKLQAIEAHRSQMKVMGHVMRRYVRATELYATEPMNAAGTTLIP